MFKVVGIVGFYFGKVGGFMLFLSICVYSSVLLGFGMDKKGFKS